VSHLHDIDFLVNLYQDNS